MAIQKTLAELLRASADEVLYNRRVKVNPRSGEILEKVTASRPIFNPSGAKRNKEKPRPKAGTADEALWEAEEASVWQAERREAIETETRQRSARRARKALFELAACNSFDVFFTLTLSPEMIDRYDYKAAVQRLSVWLDNRVRRKGLRYVAVPELHKDGAVHFHGLANSEALRLVDSGHKDEKGHTVYNVADWVLGFTTAVKLYGEPLAAAHYVAKYITKGASSGDGGTIGGRYYFHGGDLQKAVCYYDNVDYSTVEGKEVEIDGAGIRFKYGER